MRGSRPEIPNRAESGDRRAVVVGSGPNGLVAARTLARAGWQVTVHEAADRPGGGTRSEALTLDGFVHDVCSAVHPLAVASPALCDLAGSDTGSDASDGAGLEWVSSDLALAHPLDEGRAAVLARSVESTAAALGADAAVYHRLMGPLADHALDIIDAVLRPRSIPRHGLVPTARFGLRALRSARRTAGRFDGDEARALIAGCAGHSFLHLDAAATSGYALVLALAAHAVGWPIAKGGSQSIADALVKEIADEDGEVVTGSTIRSLDDVGSARVVVADVGPRQLSSIAGPLLPRRYRRRLRTYRYGPGVFKIDWALSDPIPWEAEECSRAVTVHLGGTFEEIAAAEAEVAAGHHPDRPFVIFVQPTVADRSRAPAGRHVAWGYCHVPAGSRVDMTEAIERQIERFAPGFRDTVLARHTLDSADLEARNANYIGGDINGGIGDLRQLARRPTLVRSPWVTPVGGLYLCSASTPPGGGVHGMCGWNAAQEVLRRET